MRFQDAVDDFICYIKTERGLSPRTSNSYVSWIHHYQRWMAENGFKDPTLQDFNTPVLRKFYYYLREKRGHRPRTVKGAFAPLRSLGDYLVGAGALETNPVKAITMPKQDAPNQKMTSDTEVAALLDAAEHRIHPARRSAMALAIMCIFANCALRRSELLDLRLGDIEAQSGGNKITIRRGKGNKTRHVFLPPSGVSALRAWLAVRGQAKHDFVFAYDSHRRLAHDGLKNLLEEIKAAAGLQGAENIKPHALRRNSATFMLKRGATIRDVQVMLGHTDIRTTMQYLYADEETLQKLAHLAERNQPAQSPTPPSSKTKPKKRRFRREAF